MNMYDLSAILNAILNILKLPGFARWHHHFSWSMWSSEEIDTPGIFVSFRSPRDKFFKHLLLDYLCDCGQSRTIPYVCPVNDVKYIRCCPGHDGWPWKYHGGQFDSFGLFEEPAGVFRTQLRDPIYTGFNLFMMFRWRHGESFLWADSTQNFLLLWSTILYIFSCHKVAVFWPGPHICLPNLYLRGSL